jgi:thiaminase
MDDEDYGQVMHFAKMMCATVPIMEESKEIRDIAHDYVMEVIDNEMDISVELEEEAGVEKTYDGNIVHLNFNSKTRGSA